MQFYPAFGIDLPVCDHFSHDNTDLINCSCPPESQLTVSDTSMGVFQLVCDTTDLHGPPGEAPIKHKTLARRSCIRVAIIPNDGTHDKTSQHWDQTDTAMQVRKKRIRRAVVTETDLHSAFDQIKGNNCCVCSATTQNPTKSTQDEILLRAEFTTVSL